MENKIILQCDTCKCKPICKEIDNWSKYCEEHIRLREASIIFDVEPNCHYYIENTRLINSIKNCTISNMVNQENADIKEAIETLKHINDKPTTIEFANGSEIKTIPCGDTVIRGRRSEIPIHYFGHEKCSNQIKDTLKNLKDIKYKPITKELKDTLYKNENSANEICKDCDLGLKREDCSEREFKECLEGKTKPITIEFVDMESFNSDEIKNFTNELIKAFRR